MERWRDEMSLWNSNTHVAVLIVLQGWDLNKVEAEVIWRAKDL